MTKQMATSKELEFWPANEKSAGFFISEKQPLHQKTIYLLFDGLYRENSIHSIIKDVTPGRAPGGLVTYGWMIVKDHRIVGRGFGAHDQFIGATSNAAEYFGLIHGLEALLDMGYQKRKIIIRGDSKTVIEQMQSHVRVSSPSILQIFAHAQQLAAQFSRLKWHWVPRKYNKASDGLTRRALRQYRLYANQNLLSQEDYEISRTIDEECRNPLFDLNVFNPQGMLLQ